MNRSRYSEVLVVATVALASALPMPPHVAALGTAFTYQGQLQQSGAPASGTCDFRFSLFDQVASGTQIGAAELQAGVAVANGLFTVLVNEPGHFGPEAFDGSDRWLEIEVRCPSGTGALTTLGPRQKLTATPYALYAPAAGVARDVLCGGCVGFEDIANKSVTAAKLADNFLGTTDNTPFELRVNSARALLLQPNATSPNLIGGFAGNGLGVGIYGATISGGGTAGFVNQVTSHYGTVGGGEANTAGGQMSTVSGGGNNTAQGGSATVAGGSSNSAGLDYSTVSGGYSNDASATYATISGGWDNTITGGGAYGFIGSGRYNTASGEYAAIGGGDSNSASASYATISGGGRSSPGDPSTGNRVTDDYGVIGGGGGNRAGSDDGNLTNATYATVGGGSNNSATGQGATVSGGGSNKATSVVATVGGGVFNEATSDGATVGGGSFNKATSVSATVGGGGFNEATSEGTTVSGGSFNTAKGDYATIGGGSYNTVKLNARYATIAGGGPADPANAPDTNNRVYDNYATIGGGSNNRAGSDDEDSTNAPYATVSGGEGNVASGIDATIGGGGRNVASDAGATVAGGRFNTATAGVGPVFTSGGPTVGGGAGNTATGAGATVGGGLSNQARAWAATVPGGENNVAAGDYSFAAGRKAIADGAGAFVWADSNDKDIHAWGANQFVARAVGGFWLVTEIDADGVPTEGMRLPAGSSQWVPIGSGSAQLSQAPSASSENLEAEDAALLQPGVQNRDAVIAALQRQNAALEARVAALERASRAARAAPVRRGVR